MQAAGTKYDPSLGGADKEEIRRTLAGILESASFHGSKRCQDFLAYIVDRALEGSGDSLKERTIAIEVFGRKPDADLREDTIVRVGAREVRKRLAQYYVSAGADDGLRIELPLGSYAPIFHPRGAAQELAESAIPAPAVTLIVKGRVSKSRRRLWLMAGAALLALVAALVVWRLARQDADPFDAFWRPVFTQQNPVFLVLAHPIVYHPSSHATRLSDELNKPAETALQRPISVPPGKLTAEDFIPVFDQYVGFGDSVAASSVSGLLAHHSLSVRMRLASKLDFADMQDSASVLIGAFTNRWTMELSPKLRYQFAFAGDKPCIVDSTNGKQWTLTGKSDNGRATEDYVIICRLQRAGTGKLVVIGAGLTQYGTQEAGRILSDPNVLVPLLRRLPPSWRTQEMELVLRSLVVGDTPTPPELIASNLW